MSPGVAVLPWRSRACVCASVRARICCFEPTAMIFPACMARASATESFASTVRMVPLISTMSAFVAGGADAVCVGHDWERLRSRTARDKSALRDRAISVTGTPVVISWFAIGRSYHTVLAATTYDFGILCGRGQGDAMSGEASSQERLSGVLLHVTSLPSYGGVGDFGPAAYAFVDFLAAAKQRLWQVLPLSPTGYGSSPYSALSADRKSTRLNSSHVKISYAVFCLKKK